MNKTMLRQLKFDLLSEKYHVAYILGNGINRMAFSSENVENYNIGWDNLLDYLKPESLYSYVDYKDGISPTEYYDILCLHSGNYNLTSKGDSSIKSKIVSKLIEQIKRWPESEFHKELQKWFIKVNAPVLTTNFDRLLSHDLIKCKDNSNIKFTNYYPIMVHYICPMKKARSLHRIHNIQSEDVCNQFGIWHINGMIDYTQSIKLGLTDYINQCSYIRKNFFEYHYDINDPNWNGRKTWLEIILKNNLCIVGLSLDMNETFLRWLLIKRAIYYKNASGEIPKGWYIQCKQDKKIKGKKEFLEEVGFKIIEFNTYNDIYNELFNISLFEK